MKKYLLVIFIFSIAISCKNKGETVTKENLREVLTKYGQEHKENELTIETEFGTMKLRLYDETPIHRANFIKLINEGYYDKATFYRIVSRFMIQGGVVDKKVDYTLPAEFTPRYFHKKGALAMARFDENNPGKESSATEFYIMQGQRYTEEDIADEEKEYHFKVTREQREAYTTIGGDMSLDGKYTVFGEVTEGFEVIEKIAAVKIHQTDKPVKKIPLTIKMLTLSN